jgi:eukaryotic-like serine/threonine-protein kinase
LNALDAHDAPQGKFLHAQALWGSGGDRERARRLAREGLEALRTNGDEPAVIALVEAWLAEHR